MAGISASMPVAACFRRFSAAVRCFISPPARAAAHSSTAAPRRQHVGVHRVGLRIWRFAWVKRRTRPCDVQFSEAWWWPSSG